MAERKKGINVCTCTTCVLIRERIAKNVQKKESQESLEPLESQQSQQSLKSQNSQKSNEKAASSVKSEPSVASPEIESKPPLSDASLHRGLPADPPFLPNPFPRYAASQPFISRYPTYYSDPSFQFPNPSSNYVAPDAFPAVDDFDTFDAFDPFPFVPPFPADPLYRAAPPCARSGFPYFPATRSHSARRSQRRRMKRKLSTSSTDSADRDLENMFADDENLAEILATDNYRDVRYCMCNQLSYGRMIKCDNDLCPLVWFHYACVGIRRNPKGKWYCPKCRDVDRTKMKPKSVLIQQLKEFNAEKEKEYCRKYPEEFSEVVNITGTREDKGNQDMHKIPEVDDEEEEEEGEEKVRVNATRKSKLPEADEIGAAAARMHDLGIGSCTSATDFRTPSTPPNYPWTPGFEYSNYPQRIKDLGCRYSQSSAEFDDPLLRTNSTANSRLFPLKTTVRDHPDLQTSLGIEKTEFVRGGFPRRKHFRIETVPSKPNVLNSSDDSNSRRREKSNDRNPFFKKHAFHKFGEESSDIFDDFRIGERYPHRRNFGEHANPFGIGYYSPRKEAAYSKKSGAGNPNKSALFSVFDTDEQINALDLSMRKTTASKPSLFDDGSGSRSSEDAEDSRIGSSSEKPSFDYVRKKEPLLQTDGGEDKHRFREKMRAKISAAQIKSFSVQNFIESSDNNPNLTDILHTKRSKTRIIAEKVFSERSHFCSVSSTAVSSSDISDKGLTITNIINLAPETVSPKTTSTKIIIKSIAHAYLTE